MKRGKPLRADPDKVREWLDKSRQSTRLSRSQAKPKPRKAKPRIPKGARQKALERTKGRCAAPRCRQKAKQVHHLLPQREWPSLAKEPANLVGVCHNCHADHENALKRFPRSCIPAALWSLAAEAPPGKLTGTAALAFLDRTYP